MSRDLRKSYAGAPLTVRVTVATLAMLACLLVPASLDHWMFAHVYRPNLYDLDWARLLRLMGWWPTWALASLALWLQRRSADAVLARRQAILLAGSVVASGLLCEVMKLVIRRERPGVDAGHWMFRAWSEHPLSTAGLATPSSHAMVAFAAATVAARLFPRLRWVLFALASGCAATRVLSHAHYLSDVTFGATLGWAVGWAMWIAWGRADATAAADGRRGGVPAP
ncbi:MAG TPA: phosphatase PAP2 family protein [Gemmatimonadales bacterium]|nr:phosphatase PAP2 family protein [Gemmatimonadales bacterium]